MTTYTANLNLPKPEPTELISQAWDHIGDLAEALDAYLKGSGWLTIGGAGAPAFENGWAAYAGWVAPAIKKVGPRVHFRGLATIGTGAMFTLPVGWRPSQQLMMLGLQASQTIAFTGSAANVAPSSGAASTGTAHTHGIGHGHPTVTGSGVTGAVATRIDVFTSGAVVPAGGITGWLYLTGSIDVD